MNWIRFLWGYLIIFLGHLSVSFSNDYFDIEVDCFGKPAFFSGGSGVLISHPELRHLARWIAIGLIGCSITLAVGYQVVFSPPGWFLGYVLLCNFLGWFYAAPPLRLSYRGLGELTTAFTAGMLVPGLGYLIMNGNLYTNALVFTAPLLFFGFGFILAVEIPDIEADLHGHKRTWVSRIGRERGYIAVAAMFLVATGLFFVFPWLYLGELPVDPHILGLFSLLPFGGGVIGAIRKPNDQPSSARLVVGIIAMLAACFILIDSYFIFLVFH